MKAGAIVVAAGLLASIASAPSFAATDATEISAQRRPRITVTPQSSYPGPNATRECEAWLQRENRPSGPVLTPQMRCWWRN